MATKKRAPKKKKRTRTPASKPYFACIEYNEQRFEGKGKTALDAFEAIKLPTPLGIFKTRIIARLAHNKMQSEHILFAVQFRRFVSMKMSREILCKRFELRLKPLTKVIHAE